MKTPDKVREECKTLFIDSICELSEYEDGMEVFKESLYYAITSLSSWHLSELARLKGMKTIADDLL
jgi:hypothetical protein